MNLRFLCCRFNSKPTHRPPPHHNLTRCGNIRALRCVGLTDGELLDRFARLMSTLGDMALYLEMGQAETDSNKSGCSGNWGKKQSCVFWVSFFALQMISRCLICSQQLRSPFALVPQKTIPTMANMPT